jgi:hypothetical protein
VHFYNFRQSYKRIAEHRALKAICTAVFKQYEIAIQRANKPSSGNHWAVESAIFSKVRGDNGWFTEAAITRVFKNISEAAARWYDAGERVERNGQHAKTINSGALHAINTQAIRRKRY